MSYCPCCRMLQASDLQWLSSRCPVGTSPPEQLLQFLQLLPIPHQAPPSQPDQALADMAGGSAYSQCTGAFTGCDAQVQAVVLAAAKLLLLLAVAPTALQWAAGRLPGAAVQHQSGRKGHASSSAASAEALVVRLALLGLLTPGQLGLAPSEGETPSTAIMCRCVGPALRAAVL